MNNEKEIKIMKNKIKNQNKKIENLKCIIKIFAPYMNLSDE